MKTINRFCFSISEQGTNIFLPKLLLGKTGDNKMKWFGVVTDKEKSKKTAQVQNELGNREEIVLFPSKRVYESTYSCFLTLAQIDSDTFKTSVYMTETYLGRCVLSHNLYFKSRDAALSCFNRCFNIVKNAKKEFANTARKQAELSHYIKIKLLDEKGDIKPYINQIANYLDSDNVAKRESLASENILYLPSERPISKDLL